MTLTLSAALRNAAADLLADAVDAGPGAGLLRIYSGVRPANPDTAPAGTLLAEFTLPKPAFGAAAGPGTATFDNDPVPEATGLAAGTATWARALASDGANPIDYKVSAAGGGGDVIMSTATVSIGLVLQLLSWTITQPLGTAD